MSCMAHTHLSCPINEQRCNERLVKCLIFFKMLDGVKLRAFPICDLSQTADWPPVGTEPDWPPVGTHRTRLAACWHAQNQIGRLLARTEPDWPPVGTEPVGNTIDALITIGVETLIENDKGIGGGDADFGDTLLHDIA